MPIIIIAIVINTTTIAVTIIIPRHHHRRHRRRRRTGGPDQGAPGSILGVDEACRSPASGASLGICTGGAIGAQRGAPIAA